MSVHPVHSVCRDEASPQVTISEADGTKSELNLFELLTKEEDHTRYVVLPNKDLDFPNRQIIMNYACSQTDSAVSSKLLPHAAGRGNYERFCDAVEELGLVDNFVEFRYSFYCAKMACFLKACGIDFKVRNEKYAKFLTV